MTRYILKRIFYLFLTLLIIASITFFMMKALPGTPYTNQAKLSPEQIATLNQKYGFNKPLWVQYFMYLGNLLHGDLGTSFQFNNQPVTQLIGNHVGPSVQLGLQAMILGTILGIILGSIAAIKKHSWIDALTTIVSILGLSIPSFVLAILLQWFFGFKIQLLPVALWHGFSSSILPTLALTALPLASIARYMRTEMVDVLSSDYIELARAKGDDSSEVILKHAIRNSLIPIITVIGPMAVQIMTGSMVVESIFSIPGIGNQFVQSILTNDYPTIMGLTLFYSFLMVVVILITDIMYGVIDPRIRLGKGGKA
ncbi:oligopeptide ABC transporter permease [Fructilactobacillus florum]|uniref:Oligopeptide ABC transporter, membrane-spanning subunit n=1 Tax=Fructilactobacillus florum DSM 22689 = JCM 16035 TaxID=1423745 RepID=A0A0R2CP92_9LACO|nr:oligopeptide ABC transporter permease [Fructilactobacillus florum]EKK20345.1 Oligopeptide transport system permease protein OppB [Fructilactobacillus florum 2F]KRM90219.1 oligopeptide ABC transporter, membrane-spanning subunit [Fructilactobacillus florum DSM 22689 = JCM 16035]